MRETVPPAPCGLDLEDVKRTISKQNRPELATLKVSKKASRSGPMSRKPKLRRSWSKRLQARTNGVWYALGLGFSDAFKDPGANVREDTLWNNIDAMEEAVTIIDLAEGINFSLWSNLGRKHPSAEIYVLDFPSGLRASAYLVLGGYYRQAISLQRDWLEMNLLGIYFGLVNSNREAYNAWKNGANAPIGKKLIGTLFSRAEFRRADEQSRLRDRLKIAYTELSYFTHGAGLEKYDLQRQTDNVPRYNPKSFKLWSQMLKRHSTLVFDCLVAAYGSNVWEALDREELAFFRKSTSKLKDGLTH